MAEEDVDYVFHATYDNGHWDWDEINDTLVFISDHPPEKIEVIKLVMKAPTGTIEFKDDVDLIEQIRFRKRYQRKIHAGQPDVITVQDLKDIALFTAPANIMSPMLINMLHLASTERFIRALIIYCQYYLQAENHMVNRMLELETKLRTPHCNLIEVKYRDNLADLRLLVSKEYSTMMMGGSEFKRYHHMGPSKKRRSLSEKDARLFETLLRMCVQIVWLALGRKAFNHIELEINRLFKTEIFNAAEHNLRTDYVYKMSREERAVLLGHCVRHDKKLNTRSPLLNEVFCHRPIDFRMMGLGVVKYEYLPSRLRYMLTAVSGPEANLPVYGISVGILGFPRSRFDTMLHPLPSVGFIRKSKSVISTNGINITGSGRSTVSNIKKSQQSQTAYEDIVLPDTEEEMDFPENFPDDAEEPTYCNRIQHQRWINRLMKLYHSQMKIYRNA